MADVTLRKLKDIPLSAWLRRWAEGDRRAANQLLEALRPYLERAAKSVLRANPTAANLSPKELIHEAWVRLCNGDSRAFRDRRHFFGSAVRAMHYELIDRYRAAQRATPELPMAELAEPDPARGDRYALRAAIEQLEHEFPEQAEALLLHKLGGLTLEEIAAEMGVAVITVRRYIDFAKAWVKRGLHDAR
jgi:RNA polymerase sigma factor (TIGR02999 family)